MIQTEFNGFASLWQSKTGVRYLAVFPCYLACVNAIGSQAIVSTDVLQLSWCISRRSQMPPRPYPGRL